MQQYNASQVEDSTLDELASLALVIEISFQTSSDYC